MVITFQVQIDPQTTQEVSFSRLELRTMKTDLDYFVRLLEDYRYFIRADMYIDGKSYDSVIRDQV